MNNPLSLCSHRHACAGAHACAQTDTARQRALQTSGNTRAPDTSQSPTAAAQRPG